MRTLFIASYVIIIMTAVVLLAGVQLSTGTRSWVAVIAALPALFFLVGHFFFEGMAIDAPLKRSFVARSFVSVLGLLVFPVMIVYRHSMPDVLGMPLVSKGVIVAFLVFLVLTPIFVQVRPESQLTAVLAHIRTIMWSRWDWRTDAEVGRDHSVDHGQVYAARRRYYVEKVWTSTFQKTLSCPLVDARAVVEMIEWGRIPERVAVLDIGGGDGHFTSEVVRAVTVGEKKNVDGILVVEPADWRAEYVESVGLPANVIKFCDRPFPEAEIRDQYDLVLASHSLYAALDKPAERGLDNATLDRIMSYMEGEGCAVIIMASRNCAAYEFKVEAVTRLFGAGIQDVVAEDIRSGLRKYCGLSERYVDNLIDLTGLLREWDQGSAKGIQEWLSYFLRFDFTTRGDRDVAELISQVRRFARPLRTLSEDMVGRFVNEYVELGLTRDSIVLPHKSLIYCIQGTSH